MCSELADSMNKCGPALVEGREASIIAQGASLTFSDLDEVATFAIEILEKKSVCQQDPDEDDENVDADADSSEYESALVSNASDVFGAMATVLGPDFAQAFGSVLPLISRYSVSGWSLTWDMADNVVGGQADKLRTIDGGWLFRRDHCRLERWSYPIHPGTQYLPTAT